VFDLKASVVLEITDGCIKYEEVTAVLWREQGRTSKVFEMFFSDTAILGVVAKTAIDAVVNTFRWPR
jgi:hypothetical protein